MRRVRTPERSQVQILQQLQFRLRPLLSKKRIVAAIEEHFSRLDAVDTALEAARTRIDALRRSAAATVFDRPDWTWTTLGKIAALKGGITKDSKREADPAISSSIRTYESPMSSEASSISPKSPPFEPIPHKATSTLP